MGELTIWRAVGLSLVQEKLSVKLTRIMSVVRVRRMPSPAPRQLSAMSMTWDFQTAKTPFLRFWSEVILGLLLLKVLSCEQFLSWTTLAPAPVAVVVVGLQPPL